MYVAAIITSILPHNLIRKRTINSVHLRNKLSSASNKETNFRLKKISNCAQEMWTIFYLSCLDLWNFYSAQSCIELEILCGFICHCFYMYNVHNYIVHFSLVHYYTHYSTFAIVTKVPGFNHVHGSRIFQPWLNVPGVLSI